MRSANKRTKTLYLQHKHFIVCLFFFVAWMRTSAGTNCRTNVSKYKKRKYTRQQHGRFFNRYDFAYASRDVLNQAMRGLDSLAPKWIGQTLKEIDKIAKARIKQIMSQGRHQIQKISPQIIQSAIEDVYKTPFRLLGNLGKKKFNQLKPKLSTLVKKWL